MAFGEQVIYIAWESSTGNVRLRRSTTGGITWNAATTLQLDHSGHARLARPWLVARGRRAVLATQSTVTLGTIALRVTTDRGASWGATKRPTSTALYDRHPIVVAGSAGWWLATRSCDPRECEINSLQVRTSSDGLTWSGPTRAGGGGLLYPLGGVFAPATGRVWWAWIQEPTYEQSEQWEILVRASR